MVEGADKVLKGLAGGIDGVYRVSSCANGRPVYTRTGATAGGGHQANQELLSIVGETVLGYHWQHEKRVDLLIWTSRPAFLRMRPQMFGKCVTEPWVTLGLTAQRRACCGIHQNTEIGSYLLAQSHQL